MNTGKLLDDPVKLAIGGAIVLGVVYFLVRQLAKDAGAVAGAVGREAYGLATGSNVLTNGTPYQGAGIVATPAAIVNDLSGGTLQRLGEWIGSWDVFDPNSDYDPNAGLQTGAKTVAQGAAATDALWGRIGQIALRAQ